MRAIGQSDRDRMARNHRQLGDRFTSEGWRSSKHASDRQRRSCDGKTMKMLPCLSPVGYGALEASTERPTLDNPATVFYCHRHATIVLENEKVNK